MAEYLSQTRHQWGRLVAGALMAALGFVASATGFVIPGWVWWLVAVLLLSAAQYTVWKLMRDERDKARRERDEVSAALDALRHRMETTRYCFGIKSVDALLTVGENDAFLTLNLLFENLGEVPLSYHVENFTVSLDGGGTVSDSGRPGQVLVRGPEQGFRSSRLSAPLPLRSSYSGVCSVSVLYHHPDVSPDQPGRFRFNASFRWAYLESQVQKGKYGFVSEDLQVARHDPVV